MKQLTQPRDLLLGVVCVQYDADALRPRGHSGRAYREARKAATPQTLGCSDDSFVRGHDHSLDGRAAREDVYTPAGAQPRKQPNEHEKPVPQVGGGLYCVIACAQSDA